MVRKGTGCSWLSTFGSEKRTSTKGVERKGEVWVSCVSHSMMFLHYLPKKMFPSLRRLVFSSPLLWGPTTNPIHTLRSYPLGFWLYTLQGISSQPISIKLQSLHTITSGNSWIWIQITSLYLGKLLFSFLLW